MTSRIASVMRPLGLGIVNTKGEVSGFNVNIMFANSLHLVCLLRVFGFVIVDVHHRMNLVIADCFMT